MNLSPLTISGLLAGFFSLIFGIFVFYKTNNHKLGRVWFLFSIPASVWGFGSGWIGSITDMGEGMLAWRLTYAFGVIWIAPVFYHLTCVFINEDSPYIKLHYGVGIFFLSLLSAGAFFSEIRFMFNRYYFPIAGWSFYLFFVWWAALISFSHYKLYRSYNLVPMTKRIQIKYFFLATAIGFTGGSMCYLPNFGLQVYPWGNFCVFIYPIIMSYAILKYNLMDVRVLIRRTALILFIYLVLILCGFPFIMFLHHRAINPPNISEILIGIEILLAGIILSLGPFIYAYFVKRSAYFHEHTIAGLTHELKSPLGVIESATASLLDDMENPAIDKNKISDYLKMIQNNTNRLQTFAQNLIHAAKDQNDDVVIDKKPCDVADIVRTACEHWRVQAERKNITLIYEEPQEAVIQGDDVKLHQIISNVLSNAVKFSDSGKIIVNLKKGTEQWICEVRDEGKGIAPEHLKKVFNRFFQAHPGSKGTGIGLTIAKAWVEAHSGKIWAESEGEGKGTTMRFTLPL